MDPILQIGRIVSGWIGNPPIDVPKITKKHPKTFEHPRIPSTSPLTLPGRKGCEKCLHVMENPINLSLCTFFQNCLNGIEDTKYVIMSLSL